MLSSLRLVGVLFLVIAAWPQQTGDKKKSEPPDPCAAAESQMEITQCWSNLARKAEADLTTLYQQIQKAIQARISQDAQLRGYEERALIKLRAAQLAWTHYRDAQCDAAEQQFEGGTIAPSVAAGCHKSLADQRVKELNDTYAIYLKP